MQQTTRSITKKEIRDVNIEQKMRIKKTIDEIDYNIYWKKEKKNLC